MPEPTLRTTSNPYNRLTLTELRSTVAQGCFGIPYASLSTQAATDLTRILDSAHEYIDARLGHRPWCRREGTVTLVASQQKYALPADFRQVINITETISGATRLVNYIPKETYRAMWSGDTTHPLTRQDSPYWMADGLDNSNPPVFVVSRIPTPTSAEAGGTWSVYYRPFFGLLANDSYVDVLPGAVEAIVEHAKYKFALQNGSYEKAAAHRSAREDELAALLVHDPHESESIQQIQLPSVFNMEVP
jgi:hypothetical protein